VLDFAHFLKNKADRAELDNLMRAQQASMAMCGITTKTRCGTMFQPGEVVLVPFSFADKRFMASNS
jgi:hypothetical protein